MLDYSVWGCMQEDVPWDDHFADITVPARRGRVMAIYQGVFLFAVGLSLVSALIAGAVVVAALGPVMLKLAGELADGTNTWMVGPKTMEEHIIARVQAGAQAAGSD